MFYAFIFNLLYYFISHFLFFTELAQWAPMSVRVGVCVGTCLSPSHVIFFEASHWPSDHMISSRPLIGQPSFTRGSGEPLISPPWSNFIGLSESVKILGCRGILWRWQLVFASCHQQQEEHAKRVPDGHGWSFGSWPWQKNMATVVTVVWHFATVWSSSNTLRANTTILIIVYIHKCIHIFYL